MMTPRRLAELQKLLREYGQTVNLRREDCFHLGGSVSREQRPGTNIVDLQIERGVKFTVHVAGLLFRKYGKPMGLPVEICWVEAEGYVISAWATSHENDAFAEELIGRRNPA